MPLFQIPARITETTANTSELMDMFNRLIETGGRPSAVFEQYGYKVSFTKEVKRIAEALETKGLQLITDTPDMTEIEWYTALYQHLVSGVPMQDKQKAMFADMTEEQFKAMAHKAIEANPTYNEYRTFDEFVTENVPGSTRELQQPTTRTAKKATEKPTAKKPTKRRRKNRYEEA